MFKGTSCLPPKEFFYRIEFPHLVKLDACAEVVYKLGLETEKWFLEALREALFARAERIREVCPETPIFSREHVGNRPRSSALHRLGFGQGGITVNAGYAKKDAILHLFHLINDQAREYLNEDEETSYWWEHPTIAGCEKFLKVPDGQ